MLETPDCRKDKQYEYEIKQQINNKFARNQRGKRYEK